MSTSTRRPAPSSNSYHSPSRFTDAGGHTVVRVYLCDGTHAVVDEDDFDRLVSLGFSPRWFPSGDGKGRSYVCVAPPSGSGLNHGIRVNVARLIALPASRGVVVKYADGDRLNLRRSNLIAHRAETNAKARESAFVRPGAEPSAAAGPNPHDHPEKPYRSRGLALRYAVEDCPRPRLPQ